MVDPAHLTSSMMRLQDLLLVPILSLSLHPPFSPADADTIYVAGYSALSCLCAVPSVQPKTQSEAPTFCSGVAGDLEWTQLFVVLKVLPAAPFFRGTFAPPVTAARRLNTGVIWGCRSRIGTSRGRVFPSASSIVFWLLQLEDVNTTPKPLVNMDGEWNKMWYVQSLLAFQWED